MNSTDDERNIKCVTELHSILQTGSTTNKESSFLHYEPSTLRALMNIYVSEVPLQSVFTASQWSHLRILAGIMVKNFMRNPAFSTDEALYVAPRACNALMYDNVKIARVAAQMMVSITKIFGITFWRTLQSPVNILQDMWSLEYSHPQLFFLFAGYFLEDALECMLQECPDILKMLAYCINRDPRFTGLLCATYSRGNYLNWQGSEEMWTVEQKALAGSSNVIVQCVSDLISAKKVDSIETDLIKLMTILIEYQDLASVTFQTACSWSQFVLQAAMYTTESETPLFEMSCWYFVGLKEAYFEVGSSCAFQKSIQVVSLSIFLPYLMNKIILTDEDVEDFYVKDSAFDADSYEDFSQIESAELICMRRERYVALKCVLSLADHCSMEIHQFLTTFCRADENHEWKVSEAIIIAYALVNRSIKEESLLLEGSAQCIKTLSSVKQPILIRCSSAFALGQLLVCHSDLNLSLKALILRVFLQSCSEETLLIRMYCLNGIHALVQSLTEDSALELLLKVSEFLFASIVKASDNEFTLLMKICTALLSINSELMQHQMTSLVEILSDKFTSAIAMAMNKTQSSYFRSILNTITSLVPTAHNLSEKDQSTFVFGAYRVLEAYLANESSSDDDMFIYPVYLLTALLERYPPLRSCVPYNIHQTVIFHALNSEDPHKFHISLGYISALVKAPAAPEFVMDFEQVAFEKLCLRIDQFDLSSDTLWCLADCFCAFSLSEKAMTAIFTKLCLFCDMQIEADNYDAQTCALCISRCFKALIDSKHPCTAQVQDLCGWESRLPNILKCLRLLPNDKLKAEACEGALKFISTGSVDIPILMEDMILLMASLHEFLSDYPVLKVIISNMLVIIKGNEYLHKQYYDILQRRGLRKFEANCMNC